MSNEDILNQRWSKTDKTLKNYLKKFNGLGNDTIDDLIEMFDSLDITYNDLNKPISKAEKRRLDKKIQEWKKKGLLTGYFGYLVSSKTKITYADLLEIMIYSIYVNQEEKTKELSQEVFEIVAEDIYSQALIELPPKIKAKKRKKKFSLTWEFIWSLLWIPTYNKSWDSYLQLLTLTNEQEMYKQVLTAIQQEKSLTERMLKDLIQKQINRIISVNDDKYSGVLSDTCRQLGNKIYVEPFKDEKGLQVRFIAEIDKRTTKMCRSMDNMLFNVNDWNRFYRYSDVDGKEVLYTCMGLEVGVNLPPINNHFHWCRSTITYQVDMSREELNENLMTTREKDAIQRWESFDFYEINRKMYTKQKLTPEEKQLVKDLYRALNKVPYYEAKEDQYIVRTLLIDNEADMQKIIEQHPIEGIYESLSYEAYSIKKGYHEDPNVYFYIQGSKKARNMLEYNSVDGNVEVLYQYGTKFKTINYKEVDGKHYFLLEEYDE